MSPGRGSRIEGCRHIDGWLICTASNIGCCGIASKFLRLSPRSRAERRGTGRAGRRAFTRVNRAHKVWIVSTFRRSDRIVAVTEDRANDIQAIRLGDRIASGPRVTHAAKGAADLVVIEDDVGLLHRHHRRGRAIRASVGDPLAVLLGGDLGEWPPRQRRPSSSPTCSGAEPAGLARVSAGRHLRLVGPLVTGHRYHPRSNRRFPWRSASSCPSAMSEWHAEHRRDPVGRRGRD